MLTFADAAAIVSRVSSMVDADLLLNTSMMS
jgi:hypothetical protein